MRRALLTLVAVGVFLAACADPAVRDDSPGRSGAYGAGEPRDTPGGLYASCGSVRFSDLPPDPSSFAPLAGWDDIDLARADGEAGFFDRYDWFVADQTPDSLTLFGQPASENEADPPYASASFERQADHWVPVGWGQCRIELDAPGWGNGRFVLDPAVQPDTNSRILSVLATEMACASGRAPEGRDVQAVVLAETDETVSIVILVEPAEGGRTCPSNPSFEYQVELASPLGDRMVLDASVYPALQRTWPPTESSLSSNGLSE
ncbi:MAG: hypothetical protein ACRDHK_00485 [Actinomycetota bacterium]